MFALDFLVQGNAYLEAVPNRLRGVAYLRHALAQQVRVGLKPGEFWWLGYGPTDQWQETMFTTGSIGHVKEPDPSQEIYGVPEYLAALQSALLNESATIFRRRYYDNGAHAGFIMYVSEAGLSDEDADEICDAVESAKGVGNFKNLFLHVPGGKERGVQILPISAVTAQDEFLNIKATTRDDVLAGHRTPPQMMGVVPSNTGGFGDVEKASLTYFENEIIPLQKRIAAPINRWAGQEVIRFDNSEFFARKQAQARVGQGAK